MEQTKAPSTGRFRRSVELFLQFFKIGCCTFGGGWSIIAQIQKEYVQRRQWMSDEDLLDITSVGRSLPGLMIGNVSYLFGYHVAGYPGAIACLLGVTLPPLLILTVVTWCYEQIQDNLYFSRAMTGVRAAVVPIILSSVTSLRKAALSEKASYAFFLLAFALYILFGVNCFIIIVLCGLAGFFYSTWRQKKGGENHGTP